MPDSSSTLSRGNASPRPRMDRTVAEIESFCEEYGIAESTFGRLAVNDGKFVGRLRAGSRAGESTLDSVSGFIRRVRQGELTVRGRARRKLDVSSAETMEAIKANGTSVRTASSLEFHEQRQRYHVFANTTNEASIVAERAVAELRRIAIKSPGLRLFTTLMDNGAALNRILRAVHKNDPSVPFLAVVKGRGLDDLRNTLGRMIDRLAEHPLGVLAMTNMYVPEALDLAKYSSDNPEDVIWREVALAGSHSHDFQVQLSGLFGELAEEWTVHPGDQNQPVYRKPSVLVVYREDHKFLLDGLIPRQGAAERRYDFGLVFHALLHSHYMDFKTHHVVKPILDRLDVGGRAMVVQPHGSDPAHEIVERVWPDRALPVVSRHEIIRALRRALSADAERFSFQGLTDSTSLFRFDMHTVPALPGGEYGASTLSSAWNNAVYFAQVSETLIQQAMMGGSSYLDHTRDVLAEQDGLWFVNEMFVVERER